MKPLKLFVVVCMIQTLCMAQNRTISVEGEWDYTLTANQNSPAATDVFVLSIPEDRFAEVTVEGRCSYANQGYSSAYLTEGDAIRGDFGGTAKLYSMTFSGGGGSFTLNATVSPAYYQSGEGLKPYKSYYCKVHYTLVVKFVQRLPDLSVSLTTVPATEAEKKAAKKLNVTVRNVGRENAAGTRVTVYDGSVRLSSYSVPSLSAGSANYKEIDISGLSLGTHQLKAEVDSVSGERETGNNSRSMNFLVYDGSIPVKVHFDSNGGTGTMSDQKFTYGTSAALPRNAFTRTGCVFMGWSKTQDGSVTYADGQQFSPNVHDDFTLYAVWKESFVIFDPYGGQGTMLNQDIVPGVKTVLRQNAFTRENFIFRGWSTQRGGAVVYSDGQEVDLAVGRVTLFAVWQSFAVHFDPNGGSGTMPDAYFEGDTLKLPPNAFKMDGYEFVGWSRWANEATAYADGSTVTMKALSITDPELPSGEQTLYAVWGRRMEPQYHGGVVDGNPDIVFYHFRNSILYNETWSETDATGLWSPASPKHYTFVTARIKGPARISFTIFKEHGWKYTGGVRAFVGHGSMKHLNGSEYYVSGRKVIEDRVLSNYGGLVSDDFYAGLGKYGPVTFEVSAELFDEGEFQITWHSNYSDRMRISDLVMQPSTIVRFDGNGGTVSAVPKLYDAGAAYGEMPSATHPSMTFLGWFTAREGGSRVTEFSVVPSGPVSLYAHWKLVGKVYGVNYQKNGGAGTMATQICARDKVCNLTKCAFTAPTGKTFKGWAGSNGRRYDDGMLVFDLAQPGETVTMTAIWE